MKSNDDIKFQRGNALASSFMLLLISLAGLAMCWVSVSRMAVQPGSATQRFQGEFIRFDKAKSAFARRSSRLETTIVGLYFRNTDDGTETRATTPHRKVYSVLQLGDKMAGLMAGEEIVELDINDVPQYRIRSYWAYGLLGSIFGLAMLVIGAKYSIRQLQKALILQSEKMA